MRRDRAVRRGTAPFALEHAFSELIDRLGDVKRRFGRTLLLGCLDPAWRAQLAEFVGEVVIADPSPEAARRCRGVVADEDRLPFADASFDLVVSVGALDSIDDLPGALVLIRRVLQPDGLLVAALAGAGSLPRLRSAMLAAGAPGGRASARMHPAIDVRTAGDLLARAGYVLPVADIESLDVSYAGFAPLLADVRAHGATNLLVRRSKTPLLRSGLTAAIADFASSAINDRTTERIELIYLSGWRPAS